MIKPTSQSDCRSSLKIPNVVYFIFGLSKQHRFGILDYLAVRSAYEVIEPERIELHYKYAPKGNWWERAKSMVHPVETDPPTEIFGRALQHYAHQADVLRMNLLLEHGGIYLDLDTLCLKPFDRLRTYSMVMGWQQAQYRLCNAVMLAEPHAHFLDDWYQRYARFRSKGYDRYWDEHSVRLPCRLARSDEYRDHIHVLPHNAFFFPLWNNMEALFESNDRHLFDHSYCIHFWSQVTAEQWLCRVTPDYIKTTDNNFTHLVRPLID